MLGKKFIGFLSMGAIIVSASVALAGTKVQMNLVPNSTANPPSNPSMSRSKGALLLLDKGKLQVGLSGVTDASGGLVTTTQVFNAGLKTTPTPTLQLDGSEYVVVAVIDVPILPIVIPGFPEQVQVVIPVDLKDGKGKTKIDLSSFLTLLPSGLCSGGTNDGATCSIATAAADCPGGTCNGLGRSIGINGIQVWGPIGGTPGGIGLGAAACVASFPLPPAPIELLVGDTSCTSVNGGVQLGFGGINIPGN